MLNFDITVEVLLPKCKVSFSLLKEKETLFFLRRKFSNADLNLLELMAYLFHCDRQHSLLLSLSLSPFVSDSRVSIVLENLNHFTRM